MVRRGLSIACFVATAAAAVNPVLLRLPFINRAPLGAGLTAMVEPRGYYPDYPDFVREVRKHTRRGDSIALVVPSRWNALYSHAFFRAAYLLAGREVLPVITPIDTPAPQNIARAEYLAVWGADAKTIPGQTIYEGHRGTLVKIR